MVARDVVQEGEVAGQRPERERVDGAPQRRVEVVEVDSPARGVERVDAEIVADEDEQERRHEHDPETAEPLHEVPCEVDVAMRGVLAPQAPPDEKPADHEEHHHRLVAEPGEERRDPVHRRALVGGEERDAHEQPVVHVRQHDQRRRDPAEGVEPEREGG